MAAFIKIIFIVKLCQIYVLLNEHKKTYGLKMICNGFSQNWCKSRF